MGILPGTLHLLQNYDNSAHHDSLNDFTSGKEHANEAGPIKYICIIGAGGVGLGALKTIMDTSQYKEGIWKPVAFEARDNVGGIW